MSADELALAEWLRTQGDRCFDCGWHPRTQGHAPGCGSWTADFAVTPEPEVPAVPPAAQRAVDERGMEDVPLPPERIERPW